MTSRVQHLTVALEADMREDDVRPLIDAILMLRGVLTVKEHVSEHATFIARARLKRELGDKIINFLNVESTT